MVGRARRSTIRVELPGGHDRLRQMVLYVAARCRGAKRFGRIKLNKILWKADFDSFAATGVPITGCAYQRLRLGPAPKAMLPLYTDMLRLGLIEEEVTDFGDEVVERRPIALVEAQMSYFSDKDMTFVEAAVHYYWSLTGMETSDDSHGLAWLTRSDNEAMPYEAALLSDRRPGKAQMQRLRDRIKRLGLQSE